MRVDHARGRDQAIRVDGFRVRTDEQVDAVRDLRVPRTSDTGDPAVLDAEVRFDDTESGVHDQRT